LTAGVFCEPSGCRGAGRRACRPRRGRSHRSEQPGQGKHVEAEKECREALRLRPDFLLAHLNLSKALSKQGKHAAAEKEDREALRLQPDNPDAHYNLGNALLKQGKPAVAEKEYREALRLRPDFHDAHHNLGAARRRAWQVSRTGRAATRDSGTFGCRPQPARQARSK
jgi:tetratricopeptide (TPR) repeat protein